MAMKGGARKSGYVGPDDFKKLPNANGNEKKEEPYQLSL